MKNQNLNLAKCGRGVTVSSVFQIPGMMLLVIISLAVLIALLVTGHETGTEKLKSQPEVSPNI